MPTTSTTTATTAATPDAAAASIAVATAFVAALDASNFRPRHGSSEDPAAALAAAKSRLRALLHPAFVHVVLPSTLRPVQPQRDRDDYVDYIASTLRDGYASFAARVRLAFASHDGRHVEVKAASKGVSATGVDYGQEYSLYFETARDHDDGKVKIVRFEEFVDSAYSDRHLLLAMVQ
ncbi:hypothetical protein DFJ73DRAFT_761629 [Zopfochytrium polystomum]|nr:hypothetical protein DFJ73DRAFT_761629 [Zopfochytrium polystomum]